MLECRWLYKLFQNLDKGATGKSDVLLRVQVWWQIWASLVQLTSFTCSTIIKMSCIFGGKRLLKCLWGKKNPWSASYLVWKNRNDTWYSGAFLWLWTPSRNNTTELAGNISTVKPRAMNIKHSIKWWHKNFPKSWGGRTRQKILWQS